MKHNELRRNVVVSLFSTVISTLFLFALYRHLVATLGSALVGVWVLTLAMFTLARVSELGASVVVSRIVAEKRSKNDDHGGLRVVSTAFWTVGGCSGAAVVLIAFGLIQFGPDVCRATANRHFVIACGIYMFVTLITSPLKAALDGFGWVDVRQILVAGQSAFFYLLCVLLVSGAGVDGLAIAQLAAACFFFLLTWCVLFYVSDKRLKLVDWEPECALHILKIGGVFQASTLSQNLYEPLTKILLMKFGGLVQLTSFEFAGRVIVQCRLLMVSAMESLVPFVAGNASSPELVNRAYFKSIELCKTWVPPLFFALAMALPVLSTLLIGQMDAEFFKYGAILAVAWCLNVLSSPSYYFLSALGRTKDNAVSHVIIAGGNAGLSVFFGLLLGGTGVVVGWGAALSLGSLYLVYRFHRQARLGLRELGSPMLPLWLGVPLIVAFVGWPKTTLQAWAFLFVAWLLAGVAVMSSVETRHRLGMLFGKSGLGVPR